MSIENNLREWRESAAMSREHLAERVNVSGVSIYRIENGQQQPRPLLMEELCKVFGKPAADFYRNTPDISKGGVGARWIPVIDFVQAGDFTVIAPRVDGEFEESVTTELTPSPRSFALRIRGQSMEPRFREGDLVVFDPEVYPRPEDFVVAVNEHGEASFKRYHDKGVNQAGKRVFELVPLNQAFSTWRSDITAITIRGTMIEHRRYRDR